MRLLIIGPYDNLVQHILAVLFERQEQLNYSVQVYLLNESSQNLPPEVVHINANRRDKKNLATLRNLHSWDLIFDLNCQSADEAELIVEYLSPVCHKLVLLSSYKVYIGMGQCCEHHFRPEDFHYLQPTIFGDERFRQIESAYTKSQGADLVILRSSPIFGDEDPNSNIWKIIQKLKNNCAIYVESNTIISGISLEDLAEIFWYFGVEQVFASNGDKTCSNKELEIVNCASKTPLIIDKFLEIFETKLNIYARRTKYTSITNSCELMSYFTPMDISYLSTLKVWQRIGTFAQQLSRSLSFVLKNGQQNSESDKSKVIPDVRHDNQVILITGASSTIGKTLSRYLFDKGAKLVLQGQHKETIANLVQLIESKGGEVLGYVSELKNDEDCDALIHESLLRFRKIDVLINNLASIEENRKPFWQQDFTKNDDVFCKNLLIPLGLSSALIRGVSSRGIASRIINISTALPSGALGHSLAYMTSKTAVEALTKNMAAQLKPKHITISSLEIGAVNSEIESQLFSIDPKKLGDPATILPALSHIIYAPREEVHGRCINSWRFNLNPQAEALISKPISVMEQMRFTPRYDRSMRIESASDYTFFDRGENPFGMSAKVKDYFSSLRNQFDASHYPIPTNYINLAQALSTHLQLPPENFLFSNGSDAILRDIVTTFCHPGDQIISNELIYFGFEHHCATNGVTLQKVALKGVSHNLDEMLRRINHRTRMIYLINPGNPIGNYIKKSEFLTFMDQVPAHIPIVIDEAYIEYASAADILYSHELIENTTKILIGIRTFSKMYALAGLRIGYAFSSPDIAKLIQCVSTLAPVSSIAVGAALTALADQRHVKNTRHKLTRHKHWLQAELNKISVPYIDTQTAVMPIRSPVPLDKLIRQVRQEKVYLSSRSIAQNIFNFPLGNYPASQIILNQLSKARHPNLDAALITDHSMVL